MDTQDTAASGARTTRLGLAQTAVIVPLALYAGIAAFAVLAQLLLVYLLGLGAYEYSDDDFTTVETSRSLGLLFMTPVLAAITSGALALSLGLKEAFRNLIHNSGADAPLEVRRRMLIVGTILLLLPLGVAGFFFRDPAFGAFSALYLVVAAVSAWQNIRFANLAAAKFAGGILRALAMTAAIFIVTLLLSLLLLLANYMAVYFLLFGFVVLLLTLVLILSLRDTARRWLLELRQFREYWIAAAALVGAICAIAAVAVPAFNLFADSDYLSSGNSSLLWLIGAVFLLQQVGFMLLPFLLRASARYARLRRERDAARAG